MCNFSHVHCHSQYSMLDGLSSIELYITECQKLGFDALAITDHGNMHGVVELYNQAKAANIHSVMGVEFYSTAFGIDLSDKNRQQNHLLALAQTQDGYQNLLKLSQISYVDGFYYKPRISIMELEKYNKGLVVTSGCMAAHIPQAIIDGNFVQAEKMVEWYRDIFGDRFFIELQCHPGIPELNDINKTLLEYSKRYNIKCILTNDAHYARKEDAVHHDILLCVQTKSTIDKPDRFKFTDNEYYLKSPEEMEKLFLPYMDSEDVKEYMVNTYELAHSCHSSPALDITTHMPIPEINGLTNPDEFLRELVYNNVANVYPDWETNDKVKAQIEEELGVVQLTKFASYFIIIWDICNAAKSKGIGYNTRGSAAGSIINYIIGVSFVDPLKNGLMFSRYVSIHRISVPDTDLDFEDDRREEMINYIIDKYGDDRVAQVVTFNHMKARAAVRDVGRALGIPLHITDLIAKSIKNTPGKPINLHNSLDKESEYYSEDFAKYVKEDDCAKKIYKHAIELENKVRQGGIHAAAVLIGDIPLVERIPLMVVKNAKTKLVSQLDYPTAESIGMLKVDLLGLITLRIIRVALELINKRHNKQYDMYSIPYEDESSYKLLQSGNTIGVFQVENSGLTRYLVQMGPETFGQVADMISLYRPGPIGYIPTYISRLHGLESLEYKHSLLKEITQNTQGICLSGDTEVIDGITGKITKIRNINSITNINCIDENYQATSDKIVDWRYSGNKETFRVTLSNGMNITCTSNHKFLTENGWRELDELNTESFVAVPNRIVGGNSVCDARLMKVIGYLLANGSLTNKSSVDFVSKNTDILADYRMSLEYFSNTDTKELAQIRDVKRVQTVRKNPEYYKQPSDLLTYLRSIGMKYDIGGCRSEQKFVPDFVFELDNTSIGNLIGAMWSCDGYISRNVCHYKTISYKMALDVQLLLLRFGIRSTIYESKYVLQNQEKMAYQVTTYDCKTFRDNIGKYLVGRDVDKIGNLDGNTTHDKKLLIPYLTEGIKLYKKHTGIDTQWRKRDRRIKTETFNNFVNHEELLDIKKYANVQWVKIKEIASAGIIDVYDIQTENHHNFIANGIIVHNCIYQEQINKVFMQLGGYHAGDADKLRKAISKKNVAEIEKNRKIFVKGCANNNIDESVAESIYDDVLPFALYGFNLAHAASYARITLITAWLKANYTVEFITACLQCDGGDNSKRTKYIQDAVKNGIKVLPPQIGGSADFSINERGEIVFGCSFVDGIGDAIANKISNATIDTIFNIGLKKNQLEKLVQCGMFDVLGNRQELLYDIENIEKYAKHYYRWNKIGQKLMFYPSIKLSGNKKNIYDTAILEYEAIGAWLTYHPLQVVPQRNKDAVDRIGEIIERGNCIVVITSLEEMTTKKGQKMYKFIGVDEFGAREVILGAKLSKGLELKNGMIVHLSLTAEEDEQTCFCQSLQILNYGN